MSGYWKFISIFVFGICLFTSLSGFTRRVSFSTESIGFVNDEIAKTILRHNKWRDQIATYPSIFEEGLTYWIEGGALFKNRKIQSIDDAERLYVEVYKDFIRDMNSVRVLRPFLDTFPLEPGSCRLAMAFNGENGRRIPPPYVASIIMEQDCLEFRHFIDVVDVARIPFETVCTRPLREIDGLKELYSSPVLRKSVESKPQVPEFSEGSWRFDNQWGKAHFDFTQKFCKENDLHLVILGCVGEHYFDFREFNFVLRGSQCMTLDEARKLAAKCSRDLFDFVCKDQRCLEFVKESSAWRHAKNRSPVPTPDHLAFRISFWDENIDRQPEPYIAEIRLLDSKFKYFTADEGQHLKLVYEETFDDAQSFLKSFAN